MEPISGRGGFLALHLSLILFGMSALFGKTIVASPIVVTCIRSLMGSLALTCLLVWWTGTLPWSSRLVRRTFLSGALLALHWSSFYGSIQSGSVALGMLTCAAYPLFVVLLAWAVDRQRPTATEWGCAVVVLLGLALLVPWDQFYSTKLDTVWFLGLAAGLMAALTFAGLTLINRGLVRSEGPLQVVMAQMFWAGVLLLPVSVMSFGTIVPRDRILLILLGIVFTAGAHGLFTISLRSVPVSIVGITSGLEPVYGMTFAWLVIGEVPSLLMVVGGVLIIGAGAGMLLAAPSTGDVRPTDPSSESDSLALVEWGMEQESDRPR